MINKFDKSGILFFWIRRNVFKVTKIIGFWCLLLNQAWPKAFMSIIIIAWILQHFTHKMISNINNTRRIILILLYILKAQQLFLIRQYNWDFYTTSCSTSFTFPLIREAQFNKLQNHLKSSKQSLLYKHIFQGSFTTLMIRYHKLEPKSYP